MKAEFDLNTFDLAAPAREQMGDPMRRWLSVPVTRWTTVRDVLQSLVSGFMLDLDVLTMPVGKLTRIQAEARLRAFLSRLEGIRMIERSLDRLDQPFGRARNVDGVRIAWFPVTFTYD